MTRRWAVQATHVERGLEKSPCQASVRVGTSRRFRTSALSSGALDGVSAVHSKRRRPALIGYKPLTPGPARNAIPASEASSGPAATASGVGRPRSLSKATLNCAARIPRRKYRAISLRDAGSLRSIPSGVLSVSKGDGRRGGVSWDSRTTAAGVWRPWRSSNTTRSWAARIPRLIRRMVSSLDAVAFLLSGDIGSPLSVRCIHHLREAPIS